MESLLPFGPPLVAIAIVGSGYALRRIGRPYDSLYFNVHKLISVAALVAVGVVVYRAARSEVLPAWQWALVALAGVAALATIVSGGALSASEKTPSWVRRLHHVASWATLALLGASVVKGLARVPLVLFLPAPVLAASQAAPAVSPRTSPWLQRVDHDVESCAAFAYRTREATRDDLLLVTDDLGDRVTRAWVNLGHGDVELKKVSYREDEKSLAFVFEGAGIEVRFDGTVVVPASETQEYSVLRGPLSVKTSAGTETHVVYVLNGC